jgi:hypothetical protein
MSLIRSITRIADFVLVNGDEQQNLWLGRECAEKLAERRRFWQVTPHAGQLQLIHLRSWWSER